MYPNQFFVKIKTYIIGIIDKSSPEMCATSAILKSLSKVKNHPLSENSPNLVTLPGVNVTIS
jgi:hypothetical protein